MEHPWDKDIQVYSNEIPLNHKWTGPKEAEFYIGLYSKNI